MPTHNLASLPMDHARVTRRHALKYLAAGISLTITAACAPSRAGLPPAAVITAVAAQPTLTAPRTGGTLRMGIVGDLARLDGHLVNGALQDTFWHIFDRLTAYDEKLQPQPMLAGSWDVSADGKQLKLNLRKGVQFHDGRELTSADVRWNFERIRDPKVGTLAARAQVISDYELPDGNTIIVKTERPWGEAFDLLEYVNILDPNSVQPGGGPPQPVGTGPFRFIEYAQGDHLRLARNANYWRSGQPFLDEYSISIGSDAQAIVVQLEAGALDAVDFPTFVDAMRLRNDPNYQVAVNSRSGAFYCVYPNATRPPTNDKLARQALNYALNRQPIADSVLAGLAEPQALPWAQSSPAFDAAKNNSYAFDLDHARSLLAQTGASTASFDISTFGGSTLAAMGQVYQGDLATIGITGRVKPLEPSVYLSEVQNVSYSGVIVTGGLNGHMKPMTMILGPYYGPQYNDSGFTDDSYSQLARSIANETDPARLQALYAQLNDYFLDQSWVIPVVHNPQRVAARSNVRGLRYEMHEALVIPEVWLAA